MEKAVCKNTAAVLMAVYNGARYLSEQLDSILNQTFQDWQLFVHDDGSSDHSMTILKEYQQKYPDKIIVIEGSASGGSKQNFLYLLEHVEAQYYFFSDQDDIWLEDKMEKSFSHMKELEEKMPGKPVLVFTDLSVVDSDLHMIHERMSKYQALKMDHTSFHQLMMQNIVTGCTMFINHECAVLSSQCDDISEMIMHDWWIALTASWFGIASAVDEPLMLYRQHGDNSVGAKDLHSHRYLKKRLKQKDETKNSLLLTQKQAGCFLRTFHIQDAGAEEFSHFPKYSKGKKLRVLFHYHLWKNNFIRNLGLIWYC